MPGYRPPSSEPRGKWAKRIHEKRRSDGISQTGAFELLGAALGLGPKSRAAYVALDMGLRQPTDAEAKVLADWLGGYPADELTGAAGASDTTLSPAALQPYLDGVKELLDTLRQEREAAAQDRAIILELVALIRPTADRAIENSGRIRALEAELESLRGRSGAGA